MNEEVRNLEKLKREHARLKREQERLERETEELKKDHPLRKLPTREKCRILWAMENAARKNRNRPKSQ